MAEIEYEVQAGFQDTMLARIIHAVLVAVLPPLFLVDALWSDWFYNALVLLVIACPCALVISTPVAVASGLAAGARRGVLIKGGAYLKQGRSLRWLALDKTGTLTRGRPELIDVVLMPGVAQTIDVPQIAASLASRSDHPVSNAIAGAFGDGPLAAVPYWLISRRCWGCSWWQTLCANRAKTHFTIACLGRAHRDIVRR